MSKKQFEELIKTAKFEGYYDDAKGEFDALKAKIDHHDVARDMDAHRQEIQQLLEQEIVSAYYYQGGELQVALRTDKMLEKAKEILNDKEAYLRIINREEKDSIQD